MPSNAAVSEKPTKKTYLSRFLLPSIHEQSVLLPSDRWIFDTAVDIVKTNQDLRKDLRQMVVYTGVIAAAVVTSLAVVTVAAVTAIATPVAAIGMGLAAIVGFGAFLTQKIRGPLNNLKTNTFPDLRTEIALRYTKMQTSQVTQEWKKRLEANSAQKAAPAETPVEPVSAKPVLSREEWLRVQKEARAAKKAQKETPPAPKKAEVKAAPPAPVEQPAPVAVETPAPPVASVTSDVVVTPPAQKTEPPKKKLGGQSLLSRFGAWGDKIPTPPPQKPPSSPPPTP